MPREAVPFLVGTGGFAATTTNEGSVERGMIRLHRCEAAGCSYGGRHNPNDANGDVVVPAGAAMALLPHGFKSVTNEATLTPNPAERSSTRGRLRKDYMAFGDLTTLPTSRHGCRPGKALSADRRCVADRLITAASQYIQSWLNRRIAAGRLSRSTRWHGGRRMQFACFPVSAVLSLTIDGVVIPPSARLGGGLHIQPDRASVHGYWFTRRPQNVVISYTAGYATTPPEIAQACIELVALRYRERSRIGEVSRPSAAPRP